MKDTLVIQAAALYVAGGVVSSLVVVGVFEACREARARFARAQDHGRRAAAIARS